MLLCLFALLCFVVHLVIFRVFDNCEANVQQGSLIPVGEQHFSMVSLVYVAALKRGGMMGIAGLLVACCMMLWQKQYHTFSVPI